MRKDLDRSVSAERPRGSAASDTELPGSGWTCSKKLQDKKKIGVFLARFETKVYIFDKFNYILRRLVFGTDSDQNGMLEGNPQKWNRFLPLIKPLRRTRTLCDPTQTQV